MDFLSYGFTPQAFVDLIGLAVISGVTVGILFVLFSLFYGRAR